MPENDRSHFHQRARDPAATSRLGGSRLLAPGLLSKEEKQALEDAVSSPRPIQPSVDLVREGDPTDTLFIIVKGWACRYMTTRDGARQFSAVLVPGEVGNLDALMFDRVDYGVRTITQASIVTVPKARALALAAKYPGIARMFTWLALVENAVLGKWTLSLGRRSAMERLAHLLCELSVRLDAEEDNRSHFAFPLTQEQIADALGLTAVHVNRTMQRLRADRLVTIKDRAVTLPDVAHLRQIGGFDPRYLHAGPGASVNRMIDSSVEHHYGAMLHDRRDGDGRAPINAAAAL